MGGRIKTDITRVRAPATQGKGANWISGIHSGLYRGSLQKLSLSSAKQFLSCPYSIDSFVILTLHGASLQWERGWVSAELASGSELHGGRNSQSICLPACLSVSLSLSLSLCLSLPFPGYGLLFSSSFQLSPPEDHPSSALDSFIDLLYKYSHLSWQKCSTLDQVQQAASQCFNHGSFESCSSMPSLYPDQLIASKIDSYVFHCILLYSHVTLTFTTQIL